MKKFLIYNTAMAAYFKQFCCGTTRDRSEAHRFTEDEVVSTVCRVISDNVLQIIEDVQDETDAEKIVRLEFELATLVDAQDALQYALQEISEIAENAGTYYQGLETELKAIKRTLGWMACQGWTLPEDVTFESGLKESA